MPKPAGRDARTRSRPQPVAAADVEALAEAPAAVLLAAAPPADAAESGYKDELNLAEFPIAALADRVPDGQLSLVYEDRLDQRDGPPIVRRLTITGSPKNGLPTALDDEVMVGLIQLTKRRNNFAEPRVTFSRYELIELLGWPQSGQSYQRIEEALHRWVGVVLMYENAWWDNAAKSWVDETFHILDNVTLYDRERRRPRGRAAAAANADDRRPAGDPPLPLSSFRWNEVMFRSFQSGNLKRLDLDTLLALKLPTTKRLFRFLDKRFYRRERIDFDLKTFACNHIGLSKSYAPTELKRRLKPAIDELEERGFLEPLPPEERYSRQGKGQWRILFIQGPYHRDDAAPRPEPAAEAAELARALSDRGVAARAAADVVAKADPSRVRAKIEVFDWLVQNGDPRVARNAAGYLVASIRSDYATPDGYAAKAAAAARREAARRQAEADRRRRAEEDAAAQQAARHDADLRKRWHALTPNQREAITARVRAEHPGLKRWKAMLEPLCLAELDRLTHSGEPLPEAPGQGSLFPDDEAKARR
jgi:hypothetical protein